MEPGAVTWISLAISVFALMAGIIAVFQGLYHDKANETLLSELLNINREERERVNRLMDILVQARGS
jgi:hypothetical protein